MVSGDPCLPSSQHCVVRMLNLPLASAALPPEGDPQVGQFLPMVTGQVAGRVDSPEYCTLNLMFPKMLGPEVSCTTRPCLCSRSDQSTAAHIQHEPRFLVSVRMNSMLQKPHTTAALELRFRWPPVVGALVTHTQTSQEGRTFKEPAACSFRDWLHLGLLSRSLCTSKLLWGWQCLIF